jgi:hypothetical protein
MLGEISPFFMKKDIRILDQALGIAALAHEHAILDTLEAVSHALGVQNIQGKSVRDFYLDGRESWIASLTRDFADTDPDLASRVKEVFDKTGILPKDQEPA